MPRPVRAAALSFRGVRALAAFGLLTSLLALGACQQAVGVDDHLFACTTDDDCGPGWICAPTGDGPDFRACYALGKAPDVTGDTAPDLPDGTGDDVEIVTCQTDDDCRVALGLGPCRAATCGDGVCYAPVDVEGACDDGDPCTHTDTCSAGVCGGVSYSCASPLLCREATCDGAGACIYGVLEGFCLIGSQCWEDGADHPSDGCAVCDAATDPDGWSAKANGTACDADADPCTEDDTCADGVCTPGTAVDCSDDVECTVDTCVPDGETWACSNVVAADACYIGEVCVTGGALRPEAPCEACVPATDAFGWSSLPDASPCDADGDGCTVGDACVDGACQVGAAADCDAEGDCTTDSCVSTGPSGFSCVHTPLAGSCFVDGQCFGEGFESPDGACRTCNPSVSQFAFTPVAGGTACDADGDPCTVGDACSAGQCVAGGLESCNDGLDCTVDSCFATRAGQASCANDTQGAACVIDGVCVTAGAKDPTNPCLACTPAALVDGWTPVANGTSCDADQNGCTVGDSCLEGACVAGQPASCDDGRACTADTCSSTGPSTSTCLHPVTSDACLIDGVCVAPNAAKTGEPCQRCLPATSQTAWSAASNGTTCDADGNGCTVGDSCAAGVCQPGPAAVCDDSRACTVDACESTGAGTFTCTVTVAAGSCLVDGTCVTEGSPDPDEPCLACQHAVTPTAYSPITAGLSCEGGQGFCAAGACEPLETVPVPAGGFWMGCNAALDPTGCTPEEKPQHLVTTGAYRIDAYEVSVAAFMACVEAGACAEPVDVGSCNFTEPGLEYHPMNCVTWAQAGAFCSFVGRRLCTEAEWEKASRGGCELFPESCQTDTPIYPWGNEAPECSNANIQGCETGTVSIDGTPDGDSPYGAHSMSGNVAEWVQDCGHSDYTGAPTDGSAWTTSCATGSYGGRVFRGGSYKDLSVRARSSSRRFFDPIGRDGSIGFRCCADAP